MIILKYKYVCVFVQILDILKLWIKKEATNRELLYSRKQSLGQYSEWEPGLDPAV